MPTNETQYSTQDEQPGTQYAISTISNWIRPSNYKTHITWIKWAVIIGGTYCALKSSRGQKWVLSPLMSYFAIPSSTPTPVDNTINSIVPSSTSRQITPVNDVVTAMSAVARFSAYKIAKFLNEFHRHLDPEVRNNIALYAPVITALFSQLLGAGIEITRHFISTGLRRDPLLQERQAREIEHLTQQGQAFLNSADPQYLNAALAFQRARDILMQHFSLNLCDDYEGKLSILYFNEILALFHIGKWEGCSLCLRYGNLTPKEGEIYFKIQRKQLSYKIITHTKELKESFIYARDLELSQEKYDELISDLSDETTLLNFREKTLDEFRWKILSKILERGHIQRQPTVSNNALSLLANALKLTQRGPELFNIRGIIYLELNNLEKAIENFNISLKLDGTQTDIDILLAYTKKDYAIPARYEFNDTSGKFTYRSDMWFITLYYHAKSIFELARIQVTKNFPVVTISASYRKSTEIALAAIELVPKNPIFRKQTGLYVDLILSGLNELRKIKQENSDIKIIIKSLIPSRQMHEASPLLMMQAPREESDTLQGLSVDDVAAQSFEIYNRYAPYLAEEKLNHWTDILRALNESELPLEVQTDALMLL